MFKFSSEKKFYFGILKLKYGNNDYYFKKYFDDDIGITSSFQEPIIKMV